MTFKNFLEIYLGTKAASEAFVTRKAQKYEWFSCTAKNASPNEAGKRKFSIRYCHFDSGVSVLILAGRFCSGVLVLACHIFPYLKACISFEAPNKKTVLIASENVRKSRKIHEKMEKNTKNAWKVVKTR